MTMNITQAIAWLDRQSATVFDIEVYEKDVRSVLCEAHGLLVAARGEGMTHELHDRLAEFLARTDPNCRACGSANPYLTPDGVCRHRRACEARQMLRAGASAEDAAHHAQPGSGESVFWW